MEEANIPSASARRGAQLRSNLQLRHQVLFQLGVVVRARAHVRVEERVVGVGAVRVRVSRQLAAGVALVQGVSPGEEAEVQQAFRRAGPAALAVAVVVEILHVHEPLGPEPPPDPLAEHGQVDQLSWKPERTR